MPRFTIKDLLIATTLIAIGVAMVAFSIINVESFMSAAFHKRDYIVFGYGLPPLALILLLWFGGGACIGAGLFTPFKRPWKGVVFGLVIQTFLIMTQTV